jgi:L-lactate dehydrogenase
MPGDRGVAFMAEQRRSGVLLHPSIAPMLKDCAQRYKIAFPAPV